MQQEIEAKFLNVDHDEIRVKLKAIGAVCEIPMRLMRRELFDFSDKSLDSAHPKKRLRLRDEGNKVTFTYKQANLESDYSYESETVVSSYEETKRILEGIGMQSYSYQESKRETWQIDDVEVVLDVWPWLQPYIEIEGQDEVAITDVALKLGFAWDTARFGSVETAYRQQYPGMTDKESIGAGVPSVIFNSPLPSFLKDRQA